MQKRDIMNEQKGSHFFSAQYQQEPLDMKNAEFKKEQFIYELDKDEYIVSGWIGGDIALSEKADSDWRSFVVVGKTNKGRFLILENYHSRKNSSDVIDDLFNLQKKWKYPVILETNGAQKYFANAVRKEMEHRKYFFFLEEVNLRGDKNSRLRATLLPLFENKRIIFSKELEGGELQSELLRFPKSRHDDNMDALETAISAFAYSGAEEENIFKEDTEHWLEVGAEKTLKDKILEGIKQNKDKENNEYDEYDEFDIYDWE